MYNTTEIKNSTNSGSGGSVSADNFSLQMSWAPSILKNNIWFNDNSSGPTRRCGLRSCLSSCATIIMGLALGFIIVLWIVALIADGPDEMHTCVILWPVIAGVLIIVFLFICLRSAEYCMNLKKLRQNLKTVGEPLGMRDSLRRNKHSETDNPPKYVFYHQHICIIVSYAFLAIALFSVMLASVVQFYSLDTDCYQHLENTVNELLLGYEVLAYTSVVLLSIFGCFFVCICSAILINFCIRKKE